MKFNITDEGVQTDLGYGELAISGDEKFGFRPFQLLISSIVSCSGMVFRNILKKKRIEYETIEITADIQRNPDEGNRIEVIDLTFIVSGSNLNLEQLNKSLVLARKNCAMIRSVEDSIEIKEKIQIR